MNAKHPKAAKRRAIEAVAFVGGDQDFDEEEAEKMSMVSIPITQATGMAGMDGGEMFSVPIVRAMEMAWMAEAPQKMGFAEQFVEENVQPEEAVKKVVEDENAGWNGHFGATKGKKRKKWGKKK